MIQNTKMWGLRGGGEIAVNLQSNKKHLILFSDRLTFSNIIVKI